MITDFKEYKDKKKLKKIKDDLELINAKLTSYINSLKDHCNYIPVQECVSIMHNSRTIFEIHLEKARKVLDK